jgi:hypothetical protein
VWCDTCHEERFFGFSCKRRGFCPSQSTALLADTVFPFQPVRQWALSFPYVFNILFDGLPVGMPSPCAYG